MVNETLTGQQGRWRGRGLLRTFVTWTSQSSWNADRKKAVNPSEFTSILRLAEIFHQPKVFRFILISCRQGRHRTMGAFLFPGRSVTYANDDGRHTFVQISKRCSRSRTGNLYGFYNATVSLAFDTAHYHAPPANYPRFVFERA